ncbi:uncharacterized protein LOC130452789 [Diorhabda sublineata]|uniref:uncharacterized protein LOC130452789 n=1 Tax=Diorhabda sublineata TaxID=1163346 RepID=UPI0024E14713|nr:uncharacterized protein LOC130452789 [Diorhabda sublineata]
MKELFAAIPAADSPRNVSSQEFQDMLTSWFEKKGILCELRTSLRYKMINVIKNTSIGRDIVQKSHPSTISLSKQAISLIVAEFLMKNNCDYSLSLFNTEAGLSRTFSDNIANEENKLTLQFDKENILNILELIGIHKTSNICKEILDVYYMNNERNSFLSALISVLSKCVFENVNQKQMSDVDLSNEIDFVRKLRTILCKLNVPQNNITFAIERIKGLHLSEIKNIEDHYSKIIFKSKNNLVLKEKQVNDMKKKKDLLEIKMIELIKNNNELKVKIKQVTKEKKAKEEQLITLKHTKENKNLSEQCLDKGIKTECRLEHCGTSCKENCKLIIDLQGENEELIRKNKKNLEEMNVWKTKYQNLLLEFTSFQQKISSLNLNGNSEIPSSLLPSDLLDKDLKFSNKQFESSDSSTDEIVRDARKRLKLLEEENQELADRHRNIHNKNKCKLL